MTGHAADPLCNFTPEDIDQDDRWWDTDPTDVDLDPPLEIPCTREVDNPDEYCALHKQTPLTDEEVEESLDISEKLDFAYLPKSTLKNINLSGAIARFANFRGIDFTQTSHELQRSDFRYSNFSYTDLTGKYLEDIKLQYATMEEATLERMECRDVNFAFVNFQQANLSGTRLRPGVNISNAYFRETDLTGLLVNESVLADYTSVLKEREQWEAAAKENKKWRAVAENSALPELSRHFYIEYKHCRRKTHGLRPFRRSLAEASRFTILYGESPYRVLLTSVVIIVGAVPLYMKIGGIRTETGYIPTTCEYIFEYFYFSVMIFTRLGYGNYIPVNHWTRGVVMFEAALGSLLIALLIYVLGRRATL